MSYVKVEVSLHGLRHDSLAAVLYLIESSLRSTFDLDLEGDVEVEPIESAGLARAGEGVVEMDDPLPSITAARREIEAQRWEVRVEQVDDSVHVYPGRGLMTVESVRLNRYPRTERGVHRAKRIIQRWCDRQNTKLDKGADLLSATVARAGERRD